MTGILSALTPEAREELVRDHMIELITVVVHAIPDPDRPDDRLAMKITAEVGDEFTPGIPEVECGMKAIREICASPCDDLSVNVQDALLVNLNRRIKGLDDLLQKGTIDGHPVPYLTDPSTAAFVKLSLEDVIIEVGVWGFTWTMAMEREDLPVFSCLGSEDLRHIDGKILIDEEESIYFDEVDLESRKKIHYRMGQVNEVAGRIVKELTRQE